LFPGILGLWDLDGFGGWYGVPTEQLPDATGQWFTVSIDVTSRQETGLTEIGAVIFENMDPNNLAITAYMDNLIIFGPNEAFNPSPVSGSPSVDPNTDLTWQSGEYAALHKVYFGTTNPPDYNCDKALGDTTFDPGIMDYNTTYYWRINEVNGATTWIGDVWSFTVALPPALVLMASYEPSEVGELTVTTPDPGLTITWPVLGGSGGVPTATEGDYVLKWDIVNEDDQKVEVYHGWPTRAFDLDGYDYIMCDVWIDDAAILPMGICGIWDTIFGWQVGLPTPDTVGQWITVEYDVSACDQTITEIWALLWEDLAADTGVIYTDNLRLFRSAGLEASYPSPENYAIAVDPNKVLLWDAGNDANEHDVYFGTDYNDVNDANTFTAVIYRDRWQDTNDPNYDPPETLNFDTTYYWRIDEVLADDSVTKGDVWSFTICAEYYTVTPLLSFEPDEPFTVSSGEGTVGSVEGNTTVAPYGDVPPATDGNYVMGFEWSGDPDYKVEYMTTFLDDYTYDLLGQDEMLFDVYFAADSPVPLAAGCWDEDFNPPGNFLEGSNLPRETGQWYTVVMDVSENEQTGLDNIHATLFEKLSFGIPDNTAGILFVDNFRLRQGIGEFAWNPNPEDGETGVDPDADLSWSPGKLADSHDVYFGTTSPPDYNCSKDLADTIFDPGTMLLETTYYWRIDEVNDPCVWEGDIWSFTTRNYLVVDDFESYTDTPDLKVTWAQLGDARLTLEQDPSLAHESAQSMRFGYKNYDVHYYSEACRTVSDPNWKGGGVKALDLWFYGDADNDANEQMYVKLEDTAHNIAEVPYDGDMNDVKNEEWQVWRIDLQDFSGVTLSQVDKITIGFGDGVNPAPASGAGFVWFDDIRLYIPRCFPDEVPADFTGDCVIDLEDLDIMTAEWLVSDYNVATSAPNNASSALVAWYKLDGDPNDSSNDHDGTLGPDPCDPAWVAGRIGPNSLSFDGGDYVDCGTFDPSGDANELTVSVWAYWDGTGGINQSMVAKRDTWTPTDSNMMWQLCLTDDGGYHAEFVRDGSTSGMGLAALMPSGEWVHLAASCDGTSGTFYMNGRAMKTGDFTLGPDTNTHVVIGAAEVTGNQGFSGDVDDVRLYNYALTGAEVAYLAAEGAAQLYVPLLDSAAAVDIYEDEKINFKDYAVLAEDWLETVMWP